MEHWETQEQEMSTPVSESEEVSTTADDVVEEQPAPTKEKSSLLETAYDLLDNLIAALLVVTVIFCFFFRLVGVDGRSMQDTLQDNDRLILQTAFYTPARGDVVVVYQEQKPDEPLIKRVIATGGDSLRLDVENNAVYLKTAGATDWVQLDESAYVHYPLSWGIYWTDESGIENQVTVPEGHVFVMGDHRNNSLDSRYESVGFVPVEEVIGRAIFRVSPIENAGVVR